MSRQLDELEVTGDILDAIVSGLGGHNIAIRGAVDERGFWVCHAGRLARIEVSVMAPVPSGDGFGDAPPVNLLRLADAGRYEASLAMQSEGCGDVQGR